MITVGAFEAKTHLSNLLERVAEGEEVVITKHGKPVARLVSALQIDRERVNQAFEKLKLLRKQTTLGGLSWQALRDAGRRGAHSSSIRPPHSAGVSRMKPHQSSTCCSNGFAMKVQSFPDYGIWRSPTFSCRPKSAAGSAPVTSRCASN